MSKQLYLDPARCALVLIECQNGVLGPTSVLPALAEQARPMLAKLAGLADAARAAGVFVVHATFQTVANNRSAAANSPLLRNVLRHTGSWTAGSEAVQPVSEIRLHPDDLVLPRHHGLSPTQGTEVLPIMRNLGVDTLVVGGVSLNVALPSVSVDAVNDGFNVVIPTDGVAGTPADYADLVLKHTMAMLGQLATCDQIAAAWASHG